VDGSARDSKWIADREKPISHWDSIKRSAQLSSEAPMIRAASKELEVTMPDGHIKKNLSSRQEAESIFLPFVPNVASTLKGLDIVAMPSLLYRQAERQQPLLPSAITDTLPKKGHNLCGITYYRL
jgi:hypothetical protein